MGLRSNAGDDVVVDDGDEGVRDRFGSVLCSICLEPVTDNGVRSWANLQCGHHFHLDCIGSAFNVKDAMQCPNCRRIEKGQWLFANGGRSDPEFSVDDWIYDEDLHDISFSGMVQVEPEEEAIVTGSGHAAHGLTPEHIQLLVAQSEAMTTRMANIELEIQRLRTALAEERARADSFHEEMHSFWAEDRAIEDSFREEMHSWRESFRAEMYALRSEDTSQLPQSQSPQPQPPPEPIEDVD